MRYQRVACYAYNVKVAGNGNHVTYLIASLPTCQLFHLQENDYQKLRGGRLYFILIVCVSPFTSIMLPNTCLRLTTLLKTNRCQLKTKLGCTVNSYVEVVKMVLTSALIQRGCVRGCLSDRGSFFDEGSHWK